MALSPSLDPANVARYRKKDPRADTVQPDPELDSLAAALGAAQTAAAEIDTLAATVAADRSKPPAENAIRLRAAATSIGQRGVARLDLALARTQGELDRLTTGTWAPPAPKTAIEEARASELRTVLRSLAPKDRTTAIGERLAAGDDVFLAAILAGIDPLMTGMTTTEIDAVRHRWRQQKFPTELDRIDRLAKAAAAARRAGLAFVAHVEAHANSQPARLAEIAAKAAADAVAIAAAGNRA
ncbi:MULTISPECIES: hypothetical protein [unclassified Mesorhizobium]|uniref:hypothetical protein n=1 Tax=unclassified Mesorhizobium TaxID=325217 RepID=UPI0033368CF3